MSYAENTTVSCEKTQAEIQKILLKNGASKFAFMHDENLAKIGFFAHGKYVVFKLPLPNQKEGRFWKTERRHYTRSSDQAFQAWKQECRSRWRAFFLCIRAKFEAVEAGITSFEQEFLAHFAMPDGKTFGDLAIPEYEKCLSNKGVPQLTF